MATSVAVARLSGNDRRSTAAAIAAWVESTFKPTTIGGVAVSDLTSAAS